MAKSKTDSDIKSWLKDSLDRWEQKKIDSPVIDERWYVIDYWPGHTYSDEYSNSNWRDSRSRIASGYFKSLAAAEEFVDTHDPEPGAKLVIKHQNKRRITTEEWVNW